MHSAYLNKVYCFQSNEMNGKENEMKSFSAIIENERCHCLKWMSARLFAVPPTFEQGMNGNRNFQRLVIGWQHIHTRLGHAQSICLRIQQ